MENLKHHKQQKLCSTRPAYRQGKRLKAVKIYTVSSESAHLYIYGVPKINLRNELKSLCSKYGIVKGIYVDTNYEVEAFTECFHVTFNKIQSARIAKRILDGRSFYGNLLHICYAPECETVDETRTKLFQRKKDVIGRLNLVVGDNTESDVIAHPMEKFPKIN